MNVPNFAIPGLMAPTAPNFEEVSYCHLDGSIRKEVFRQGMELPDPVLSWDVRNMDNVVITEDCKGIRIFKTVYEGMSIFILEAIPETFPPGHTVLTVYVAGAQPRHISYEIHRKVPCVTFRCE